MWCLGLACQATCLLIPLHAVRASASPGVQLQWRETSQCASLSAALGAKVSFASQTAYNESISSYWSTQEASLKPGCVVSPTSSDDVSRIVKTIYGQKLAGHNVNFAIRSGGHTPFAGSANIQDGITIDLRGINGIELSADRSVAHVGAGQTWGPVYEKLEAEGLVVIGGRRAYIGVGGLSTGGGISYLSAQQGFACDNIINYEVVLADGSIVNANNKQNPDLFLALKGGSNNLGVVTRFDMKTYPGNQFWGGLIVWPDSASQDLMEAFANLNLNKNYDKYAAMILSFSSVAGTGDFASINLVYTQPTPDPPTLKPFYSVQPQLQNTMKVTNQSVIVSEFAAMEANGRRQVYITNSFKNNLNLIREVYALTKKAFKALPQTPGVTLSFNIQPISAATTAQSVAKGGNMLGLEPNDAGLVVCLFSVTWDNPAEDLQVQAVVRGLNEATVLLAKAQGLSNKWIYLNYAANGQDPIAGYGAANKAKLQAASKKYDSHGLFQQNVPGGFKLFK